jgi:hypothetical protein
MGVFQSEEPAAGKNFRSPRAPVGHVNDRLHMRRHRALRHQLVELNQCERPIARIGLNRLRTALGVLLHNSEYYLPKLQQIAMAHSIRLPNSHAVDERAVRTTKIPQQ